MSVVGKSVEVCAFAIAILAFWIAVAHAETGADEAARLVEESGVRGGLIVHVGCGDGLATARLRTSDSFLVHGLDADPARVATARQHASGRGDYGPWSIAQWTQPDRLPYAENMVNLLLVEDAGGLAEEELLRVLVPGGVAYWKARDGTWRRIEKRWPEEMDEWSHWEHGPDGNPVSQDTIVGPPRRAQWIDGPSWSKKHWGPRLSAIVTAGGRLFCVQDETPTSLFNVDAKWVLTARDAFNGAVLWRRELPDWTTAGWGRVIVKPDNPPPPDLILGVWGELSGGTGTRDAMKVMVAAGDRLYVPLAHDAPLSAIDAASGEVIRTFQQVAPVGEVLIEEGLLLIGGRGKLCAVEANTGRLRWEAAGANACALGGKAFFTSPRGRSLVCVELESGSPLWEVEFARAFEATGGGQETGRAAFTGPLRAGSGILLAASQEGRNIQFFAVAADDGAPLWRREIGDRPFGRGGGPFFIDGLIWNLDADRGVLTALNPLTGELEKETAAPAIRFVGHHARCYLARATCRYVIGKERGADFIDLETGEVSWNNWLRGPCHRGVLPANGLLYAGQHSCRCYTEAALHGFHALAPAGADRGARDAGETPRLQKGPGYNSLGPNSSELSGGWPTFRHDAMRSGATDSEFPAEPRRKWSAAIGGKLTAPVVALGRVYVAAVDRHTLYALDAETGEIDWQFIAGGRVDSPPTIHEGLALLGCRDGWVYCLRADDGSLNWRFRAAPEERLIGAHGQLESAWPVPGSILVKQGIAYCVAGRSSYLDGGLQILALQPHTGELLQQRQIDGPWPSAETGAARETPNRGYTSEGAALPDVLVADAGSIYLRHLRLDDSLQEVEDMQPNFYASPALSGENRGGDHKYWDNLIEVPRHAVFTDPNLFHRSFFENYPGLRLYATTGLLDDDSWHRRMYWSYGQVVGQYLVFRGRMGYSVQVFATSPREGGFNAGDGYVVYAGQTAEREEGSRLFALPPQESKWRIRVPFRPVAMVLAGENLILAGPPDLADPHDALAAVEGRRGGTLWVLRGTDGGRLAEVSLPSPPRYDSMAIAGGKCYLATVDGEVVCLAGRSGR